MKATLQVINQMKADGVIGQYAIGGAVGATFYLEPTATFDIDVFVSLEPVYSYLKARGCRIENEYVIIGCWQVQFLPPGDGLDEEGLIEAVETDVDGVNVRVMTAEHLVTITLRTGRAKDKIRIVQFLESKILDEAELNRIVTRHGLLAKWEQFKHKYVEGCE